MKKPQVYLYDGFELKALINEYVSLKFVRCFRGVGMFTLILNDEELAKEINLDDILLIDKDAYFIENYHSFNDESGEITYEFSGNHINSLLKRRVTPIFTLEPTMTYENSILKCLNENMILPVDTARKIEYFTMKTKGLVNKPTIAYTFENVDLLELVNTALGNVSLGYAISFLPEASKVEFELLESEDKSEYIVFSDKYRNIANSDVYIQNQEMKNVSYLNNEGTLTMNGYASGIQRREVIMSGSENEEAVKTLKESRQLTSAEFSAIDTELYQFGVDYDLGDVVTFEDYASNLKAVRPLLEVNVFCCDSVEVAPTFGDTIPTIFQKLKKVRYLDGNS